MADERPMAFVLMPFDSGLAPVFERLITPALEGAGYEVRRADSQLNQQNVLADIVAGIGNARLVVADLTSTNPNVLYELGLCHGLEVPVVMVTQSIDDIPFDLRSYRVVRYSMDFTETDQFKRTLKEIAREHLGGSVRFGSPVKDFLGRDSRPAQAEEPQVDASNEEEDATEAGLFDHLVAVDEASNELERTLEEISTALGQMNENTDRYTAELHALGNAPPAPNNARKAQQIGRSVAQGLRACTRVVTEKTPELESETQRISEAGSGYAKWLKPETPEDRRQLEELRTSLRSLLNATQDGLTTSRELRDSFDHVKGMTGELNRAASEAKRAWNGMISVFERLEASLTKTINSIDRSLGEASEDNEIPRAA